MIIKMLIAFLLLILFAMGPQLSPMKKDVMDDKTAEYKLAAFASEFQKVYPSLPIYRKDRLKNDSLKNGMVSDWIVLDNYGFSADLMDECIWDDNFEATFDYSNSEVINPFTGKKIQGDYLILKQKTDKGEKVKIVEFGLNTVYGESY